MMQEEIMKYVELGTTGQQVSLVALGMSEPDSRARRSAASPPSIALMSLESPYMIPLISTAMVSLKNYSEKPSVRVTFREKR